ncbi:hypothetical protein AP1_0440 [Aeromonas phage AP1]|nr:hypothetical protein AP1_0440 [Aeromonas phage AP1]
MHAADRGTDDRQGYGRNQPGLTVQHSTDAGTHTVALRQSYENM